VDNDCIGRITEECNEILKDNNDNVVMYYWTELKPSSEVLSLMLNNRLFVFKHLFRYLPRYLYSACQ